MIATILKNKNNIFLSVICLAICIVIFIVGLWPMSFHPKNEVEWLPNKNGIRFYGQGIVYSSEYDNNQKPPIFQDKSISIELWLQPETEPDRYVPHIFSFYDGKGVNLISLRQWKSYLEIVRSQLIRKNNLKHNKIGLRNALPVGILQFITISSEKAGTAIYINGKLAKFYHNYTLIDDNMKISGQLVLGNSPTGKQPWTGNIFGLAIYNRSLNGEEVFRNYQNWLKNDSPTLSKNEDLAALYLFDEHYRTLAHNKVGAQHHLLIPKTFQILKKSILGMPWKDFRLNLSYLKDILVNIVGFIPFGFIFSIFLYNVKQLSISRIYLITIFLGGGISLIIELLQAYLVTRSSQMTDLICNILGTILGVVLSQHVFPFIFSKKSDHNS